MTEPELTGLDWLFAEIHRRRLIPAAGVYVVVCWFLVQLLATIAPYFTLPEWALRVGLAASFAGLPLVLGAAWVAGGGEAIAEDAPPAPLPRVGLVLLVALAFVGGALWAYRQYGISPRPAEAATEPDPAVLAGLSPTAVAVLPFGTIGGDASEAYFGEGVAEEIRTALARVPGLRIVSRTSSAELASSGKSVPVMGVALGAGSVLEGSVQRADQRLRVTVRLVDARTDKQLWTESFDRSLDLQGIFAVEEEIARAVAGALAVQLAPGAASRPTLVSRPPISLEAHDLYLLGLHHWNLRTGEELRRAADFFRQAVARDPTYALAHAGLANTWVLLPLYTDVAPSEAMPQAQAEAERSLALDSTLAEAHAALGMVRMSYDWDWSGAEQAFQRTLALNPSYATGHEWYGVLLDMTGRPNEGLAEHQRALALDPLSLIINEILGNHWYFARDYARARTQYERTLELQHDFPIALEFLSMAALVSKDVATADSALVRWSMARGVTDAPWSTIVRGITTPAERDGAVRALQDLEGRAALSPYRLATLYALAGATEPALAALERGERNQDFLMFQAGSDPALDALRGQPRFAALLRRMRLAPPAGAPPGGA